MTSTRTTAVTSQIISDGEYAGRSLGYVWPTKLLTKAQLTNALSQALATSGLAARMGIAANNVCASMKRETTRVV